MILLLATAFAESWCASPLVAHEWGVTVLHPKGGAAVGPAAPAWFHTSGSAVPDGPAVRTLPPDSGERDLPVVHFYAASPWADHVPVGVEVGFTRGEASAWFPAVTERTPAATANSAAAYEARKAVLAKRPSEPFAVERADPGRDPTRQLHWDRLLLSVEPLAKPQDTGVAWVPSARAVPDALWVNGPGESDRFLFYEAETRETSAVVIEPGDSGKPGHYILRNTSDWDVFDVVFVHEGRVWTAPRIPAGKTAGFLLRDPFDPAAVKAWLEPRWTDTDGLPQTNWEECVMMRDPAVPTEKASSHRLLPTELAVLFDAWEGRLLGADGTRLLYREDPAALDAVMPLSIYTDMYHYPVVHRLGVVMVVDPEVPR